MTDSYRTFVGAFALIGLIATGCGTREDYVQFAEADCLRNTNALFPK